MSKIRVTNYIIQQLAEVEGVEYFFGITGKSISALVDACADFDTIQFISTRHEAGASFMAYGYAQATGKLGLCLGTSGGGGTNMLTGVASAYMNSVPMLVFSGQVPVDTFGRAAFQESTGIGRSISIVDTFKPVTKASFTIEHPNLVPQLLSYAIKTAYEGRRGPVHISIPVNVQLAHIDLPTTQARLARIPPRMSFEIDNNVMRAIDLLRQARQPVLFVGWGVALSFAAEEVLHFAQTLQIPYMTTPQAKGVLPSDHPLALGMMGLGGHARTVEYLRQSDLIVAVGSSFNEFATLNWNEAFYHQQQIIQIDIDFAEIDKNIPITVGVQGDARAVFRQFRPYLDQIGPKTLPALFEQLKSLPPYDEPDKMHDRSTPIKPQRLVHELRQASPADTIFLADSGAHCAWALNYLDIYAGGHFYAAFGLGAMGITVAASMGIQLAKPQQAVVAIVGDGTLLMHGTELSVAAQYNIPVIWVVMNDSMYAMPAQGALRMYGRLTGIELSKVDFALMAQSFGLAGYTITQPDTLAPLLQHHLQTRTPAVFDVLIDRTEIPALGARLNYGKD